MRSSCAGSGRLLCPFLDISRQSERALLRVWLGSAHITHASCTPAAGRTLTVHNKSVCAVGARIDSLVHIVPDYLEFGVSKPTILLFLCACDDQPNLLSRSPSDAGGELTTAGLFYSAGQPSSSNRCSGSPRSRVRSKIGTIQKLFISTKESKWSEISRSVLESEFYIGSLQARLK